MVILKECNKLLIFPEIYFIISIYDFGLTKNSGEYYEI